MTNIFDYYDDKTYLAHHGILGQKWGVRRTPEELGHPVSKSTTRMAKKDAKEFARAKMYYGEGAGNRRKLIKATVEERSKKIPDYKEEFDKYLQKQDMAKHASKAKTERKVNNAVEGTKKTTRGIINIAAGNIGRASAAAIALYGAYSLAKMTGADKAVINAGKNVFDGIVNSYNKANFDAKMLKDVFK